MTRTDADNPQSPRNPRNPRKQKIIDALKAAAKPSSTGELYLRPTQACKIIGATYAQITRWERDGKIKPLRFRVTPRRGASMGIVVAWPLPQVIACAKTFRPMRERCWSDQDQEYLLDQVGRKPMRDIAKHLGRSINAVQMRCRELGISRRTNQGLMTTGETASVCRRTRQAVNLWCMREGLKFRRLSDGHRDKMINPVDLAAFLKARPLLWSRLPEAARRTVERMAEKVVLPARPSKQTYSPRVHRGEVAA